MEDLDLGDLLDQRRPSRPPASRREPPSSEPRDIVPTPPTGTAIRIAPQKAPSDLVFRPVRGTPPPDLPPPTSLEACLARLGVSVVETDGEGRIARMNDAAERL